MPLSKPRAVYNALKTGGIGKLLNASVWMPWAHRAPGRGDAAGLRVRAYGSDFGFRVRDFEFRFEVLGFRVGKA